MEYTFRRNLYGEAEATLSIEQQAFGLWLSEDMHQPQQVQDLLKKLAEMLKHPRQAFTYNTEQFHLDIDHSSVELHANNRSDALEQMDDFSAQSEDHDQFQLSDDNHHAHCGPEDFYALLQAWAGFL